jgi:hypothetical protein
MFPVYPAVWSDPTYRADVEALTVIGYVIIFVPPGELDVNG